MINTYQSSLAPPPLPPRLNRSHQVLIPAHLPPPGRGKNLVRFLVGLVVLQLFLSVAGFLYLYNNETERGPSAAGQVAYRTSEKQDLYYRAMARMVASSSTAPISTSGYLQWDMGHSVRKNINYYHNSWLTILESGDYYIFSKVTFTRSDLASPLANAVKLRKDKAEQEETLMIAFCSLGARTQRAAGPGLCTASQVDVVTLQAGNQLGVWIENLSQVDYEESATVFGIYKL